MIASLIERITQLILGRPRTILAVALAVVVGSGVIARRLRLDPDLLNLIPQSNREVNEFRSFLKETGMLDLHVVVLEFRESRRNVVRDLRSAEVSALRWAGKTFAPVPDPDRFYGRHQTGQRRRRSRHGQGRDRRAVTWTPEISCRRCTTWSRILKRRPEMPPIVIDLRTLYGETAKLAELPEYEARALALAGSGGDLVLTGQAPIWLYLRIAHRLHGHARRLAYRAPVLTEGDLIVFDHDAY